MRYAILLSLLLCWPAYAQTCPNNLPTDIETWFAASVPGAIGRVSSFAPGEIIESTGTFYSPTAGGCVTHEYAKSVDHDVFQGWEASTFAGHYVNVGNGDHMMEIVPYSLWLLGIRPTGYSNLNATERATYDETVLMYDKDLTSRGITSGADGTKVYTVPDGGSCKLNTEDTDIIVPGGANSFTSGRRWVSGPAGMLQGSGLRTTRTDRVSLDSIKYYGGNCCKIKLTGTFNVPSGEQPGGGAGTSTITTTVYECNSSNLTTNSNGNIEINHSSLGTPVATAPAHTVDWSTIPDRGGNGWLTSSYGSFTGEFILEVPCGSCRIVKFEITTTAGTYALIYAAKCEATPCTNYHWGF